MKNVRLLKVSSMQCLDLFVLLAMGVSQLRSNMIPSSSLHMNQGSSAAMTVPPPTYVVQAHHQLQQHSQSQPATSRPHDEREQKNNALQILKMLCETPLLQAYLLDLLKAR